MKFVLDNLGIKFVIKNGRITRKYTHYKHDDVSCILEYKTLLGKQKQHATQKPLDLMEKLVSLYSKEGDTVLDFCMGSGTTGVACKNLNRNFIGIEKEEKFFNIAKERIKGVE